ncbi:MAG: hypothetical protein RSD00_02895 [Bacilli bacterium]
MMDNEKYILDDNDIKRIQELIIYSSIVHNTYERLFLLELHNKKDTPIYRETIEDLRRTLIEEKIIYEEAHFTFIMCKAYIKYITKFLLPDDIFDDLDPILQGDYKDMRCERVINRLFNIITSIKFKIYKTDNELCTFINNLSSIAGVANDGYDDLLESEFIKDFYSSVLTMIDKRLKDPYYKDYYGALLKCKYDIAFCVKEVEKESVDNNFVSPKQLYLSSLLLSDILNIDKKEYDNKRKQFMSDYAYSVINLLLSYDDEEYLDYQEQDKIIITSTFLISLLMIADEDTLEEIKENYYEDIESSEYLEVHEGDKFAKQDIEKNFDNAKENIEVPIILSYMKKGEL